MSHRLCLAFLLIAACGPSGKPTTTGNVDPSARACPAAETVRLALWQTPDGYGDDSYGTPKTAHWQVPLEMYARPLDDSGVAAPSTQVPGPRTEAEVRAMIDGPLGAEAWLYVNGAAEPCQGRVVSYYLAGLQGDLWPYELLAAEVDGCAHPEDWKHQSFAVIGADPTGCSLSVPEIVERRDIEIEDGVGEEQGTYRMPDGADQLPPVIASVITPPPCETAPCRPLWDVRRAGVPGQYVYDVSTMWLTPGTPGDECSWMTSDSRALYLGGDVAQSKAAIMTDGIDWDTGEPAMVEATVQLDGVLHDAGGARLVLTSQPGRYGVHAPDGSQLGAGAMHDWYVPHEEDFLGLLLGPGCGL